MVMKYTPNYQNILIELSKEYINFYAQEMGFFKKLLETEEDDKLAQWYKYFITIAESKMEEEYERLKLYRAELTEWESEQERISIT